MVRYIQDLLNEVKKVNGSYLKNLLRAVSEELERLDPRDFLPDIQQRFVGRRAIFRMYRDCDPIATGHGIGANAKLISLCDDLIECLDSFAGVHSAGKRKAFPFVSSAEMRRIIERDYFELRTLLFPSGAWKSTVIMAGSILEAILFDVLSCPKYRDKAVSANKAPKYKQQVKPIEDGEWKLADLIAVAVEIGALPEQRADTIDQVLRDYRNFVHPKKEIKAAHQCTEAEAFLAIGALDGVCNHFEARQGL